MNTSGSEIKIITGNANQELAAKIAEKEIGRAHV